MKSLPIESVLPELKQALLHHRCAVLVAEPGAGKTTQVPLALLDEPWLQGQRIIMLEPRRLAARAAARYMAGRQKEQVGQTIGYRVKNDTKVGAHTRIEVITEGVLTRMLQHDPALEGVGVVIFDEFHERSLHADLGLALCRQSQTLLREDLRIVVMSATLEAKPVAAVLDDAPVIYSEGRAFPVATHYLDRKVEGKIEPAVVKSIQHALQHHEGSLLVFLPGAAEIRRVEAALRAQVSKDVGIAPLYGNLAQEAQDQALTACPPGMRKVVLATSIAETSLTVEGVTVVIDSGLMRVPRFSPRTGMSRLTTVPVSAASADQRRGRAGRLGPGVCYRLWTEQEQRQLPASGTPEIREADLASLALELAAWGVTDPAALVWLDPPPAAAYQQARELLVQLGALREDGGLTPHGRRIAELGLHPRLAHMVLQAMPLELGAMACELAVMLSERDFMRAAKDRDADVRTRIEVLWHAAGQEQREGVDLVLCSRIAAEAKALQISLGIRPSGKEKADASGLLLAFAYPDRIAQRRSTGRFLLSSGRGAVLPELQTLSNERYLAAAELDDHGVDSRVYLAAPVQEDELLRIFEDRLTREQEVKWDHETQSVKARQRVRLGALTLKEGVLGEPPPEQLLEALIVGIRAESLEVLPWSRSSRQLQQRISFLNWFDGTWPDMSESALLAGLEDWLGPHLYGMKSRGDLQRLKLADIIEEMLSWEQRRWLDEMAPTHMQVPSGSRIPIDYSNSESPTLSVRLQEMFGLAETPRIARGRVPLTLHLLSPAQRPVQVTKDLASFWRNAYFEVKKDLKGRYPKHYWPEDPMAALPTHRAKPRT
ncbi:ATP-dependent helicase HrpB [Paenibacillus sp. SI8]|uniref:ATP-dependent helicase HrpB n=1 Tax=unclassified Paenibacillus TaxID=185978 RepID=UPI0034678A01